jgi:hypothetical protein
VKIREVKVGEVEERKGCMCAVGKPRLKDARSDVQDAE